MFGIIKSIIWVAGILVIAFFAMDKLGYGINGEYFSYSKKQCQEKLNDCSKTVLHTGIDSVNLCNFNCVDPQLIINKK